MKAAFCLLASLLYGGCVDSRPQAEGEARAFLRALYPGVRVVGVQCQSYDTDNNGYVSCTARLEDQPLLSLECTSYCTFLCNSGCREARATLSRGRQ